MDYFRKKHGGRGGWRHGISRSIEETAFACKISRGDQVIKKESGIFQGCNTIFPYFQGWSFRQGKSSKPRNSRTFLEKYILNNSRVFKKYVLPAPAPIPRRLFSASPIWTNSSSWHLIPASIHWKKNQI